MVSHCLRSLNLRAPFASERRPGIAIALIVIIIVIVLVIASVGAYFALSSSKASSTSISSTSSQATATTSTTTIQGFDTTSFSSVTSSASGMTYYSGTYNFSLPEGPSGVRSLPNGSAQYYNSVQTASGVFNFSIAAGGLSGSGSGHGTFTMSTSGFCTGSDTFPYTFPISDVTTFLGGNITIFFGNPVPGNYTVSLTCTGDMNGVSTATNNPGPFLPVYPNEISVPLASVPFSGVFHATPSTTFVWGYSLKETSG